MLFLGLNIMLVNSSVWPPDSYFFQMLNFQLEMSKMKMKSWSGWLTAISSLSMTYYFDLRFRTFFSLDNSNCNYCSYVRKTSQQLYPLVFDARILRINSWNYCWSTWNRCCEFETIIKNQMPVDFPHCLGEFKFILLRECSYSVLIHT